MENKHSLLFGLTILICFGCSSPRKTFREDACLRELKNFAKEREQAEARRGVPVNGAVGLTRNQVEAVFQRNKERFKTCYESHANLEEGKFVFSLLVSPQGRVDKACAAESNFDNFEFHGCMMSQVRALRFPATTGGVSVTITYPYQFVGR
jgi:hypothetical protein